MMSATIQPFCWKNNINIGYYDGYRVNFGKFTQRDKALKILKNHFCSIWKSSGVSFNQAIENQLKPSLKGIDNVTSEKHVKSFIK